MASGWHIGSFLQAITACCSNFVGKTGRTKVTMMVVSLLTLTEIVFETKTLVDGIKRKNMLAGNDSLTYLDDQHYYDMYFVVMFYFMHLAMWQRFYISLCGFVFSTMATLHQK